MRFRLKRFFVVLFLVCSFLNSESRYRIDDPNSFVHSFIQQTGAEDNNGSTAVLASVKKNKNAVKRIPHAGTLDRPGLENEISKEYLLLGSREWHRPYYYTFLFQYSLF